MGGGSWIQDVAQTAYSVKHSIPVECPAPDWGTWEAFINLWIAKWGGGSLIGGALLGWLILGGVLLWNPINKLMAKLLGFNLDDLKETVRRRKENENK